MTTYNIFEYRLMDEPVRQETGHALEKNKHHYKGRNAEINLFGLHIAVTQDDKILPDMSAENLNQYGATTATQASWHVAIDTDSICPALRDGYTAWVQGVSGYNFNSTGLGAEIATWSTDWDSMEEWRKYRFLRHLAAWFAPRVMKYGNDIRLRTDRDYIQKLLNENKPAGFAYHSDLSPSTRLDPGLHKGKETFPIKWFFELLRDEINIRLGMHGDVYKTGMKYVPYGDLGTRVLQIFTVGEDVKAWQNVLVAHGYSLTPDGVFGPNTEAKTLALQAKKGLIEDGIVGPATIAETVVDEKPIIQEPVVPVTPLEPRLSVTRVGGKDRFETNAALSSLPQDGIAYVCNGLNFPDALSAASRGDGYVFLTRQDAMPSKTLAALVDYHPRRVVIVGSAGVVSDTVMQQVKDAFTN